MNKAFKVNRSHLFLVLLGAGLLLGAMWFTLLAAPRTKLSALVRARNEASASLDKARKSIAEASQTKASIDAAAQRLQDMEAKMPVGDPYRWLIKAFVDFPAATNVMLANIEPPHVSETVLLPKVPYKTASFLLTGTAHYHEFGAFLAALENHFPHMRVKKLDLSPAYPGEADSNEAERLNFQLELTALFKTAPAPPPAQLSLRPAAEKRN
jgi:hypothetical protein